jgi:hypothetical protein
MRGKLALDTIEATFSSLPAGDDGKTFLEGLWRHRI